MDDARKKKTAVTAASVGAAGIAAALIALSNGGTVDCSIKERCHRAIDSAGAEVRCHAREDWPLSRRAKCVEELDEAWHETEEQCGGALSVETAKTCKRWAGKTAEGVPMFADGGVK